MNTRAKLQGTYRTRYFMVDVFIIADPRKRFGFPPTVQLTNKMLQIVV